MNSAAVGKLDLMVHRTTGGTLSLGSKYQSESAHILIRA
jgi:hypothetical protein